MIDVLSTLNVVLRDTGFVTHLVRIDLIDVVCFEDDAVMGFGCVFDSVSELKARWKEAESSILRRYASGFRSAGDKAWNVYCLFLCGEAAESVENAEIRQIDENLERTRKIAAVGIGSREDLVRALLPIIPLQYDPEIRAENLTDRLNARIRAIAPRAAGVVLDAAVSPGEVVRLLGGAA